jgi:hypothetical protein
MVVSINKEANDNKWGYFIYVDRSWSINAIASICGISHDKIIYMMHKFSGRMGYHSDIYFETLDQAKAFQQDLESTCVMNKLMGA